MALTRKALKAMGLTEEQVDSIIEAHTETVDGLKNQITTYKADAEKLQEVQRELDDLKNGDDWKSKYDAEKAAHDKTKSEHTAKEVAAKKNTLYRTLLKDAGVDEKRIDSVLKLTDFTAIDLDGEKLKDADALTTKIKDEWKDFIAVEGTKGANVDNPPPSGTSGGAKSIPTIF